MFTGMILIDLQEAFDTIDHEIFLDKIASLGFSDSAILWFESYLQDRSFSVNIGKEYVREACESAHDSFYLCVVSVESSNEHYSITKEIWTRYNPVNEINFYDILKQK